MCDEYDAQGRPQKDEGGHDDAMTVDILPSSYIWGWIYIEYIYEIYLP